mgnify:CR=1 FL=1
MYKLVTLLNDKAVSTDKVWDKAQAYRMAADSVSRGYVVDVYYQKGKVKEYVERLAKPTSGITYPL